MKNSRNLRLRGYSLSNSCCALKTEKIIQLLNVLSLNVQTFSKTSWCSAFHVTILVFSSLTKCRRFGGYATWDLSGLNFGIGRNLFLVTKENNVWPNLEVLFRSDSYASYAFLCMSTHILVFFCGSSTILVSRSTIFCPENIVPGLLIPIFWSNLSGLVNMK